jgi:membrane associated rhomboid family serine protease
MSLYRYSSHNYYRPSPLGGFRFFSPVIKALLVSNIVIYMLAVFFGMFRIGDLPLAAIINYVFALYPLDHGFEIWQLLTYMFMHGGFMHLLFNMFALWMFGMELENTWGSRKFLTYYMLCGLGAGLSNLFIAPLFGPTGPTVGASGSIYGVLLAFGLMFPDRPIFVYFLLPIRAKYFVLIYILLEIYAGVTGSPDGIAHFAHLGGAAVGFVFLLVDSGKLPIGQLWEAWRSTGVRPTRYGGPHRGGGIGKVSDADYYDVQHPKDEDSPDQAVIDEILDKISKHGYQNLSEEEKRILFEASKKMN